MLGVITPLSAHAFDPVEQRLLARCVQGGLVDAIWVRDLPCAPNGDPDRGQGDDPFAHLARASAAHPDLRVMGTASVILGTRHPLVTARAAAGAQVHARGGFVLGLGSAGKPRVAAALGVDAMTVPAVREEWAQIRAYLHGDAPVGSTFDVPDGFTPPPMWLASSDTDKWRAIGPMADGWLTFLTTPEDFTSTYARVTQARGAEATPLSVGVRIDLQLYPDDADTPRLEAPVRGVLRCTRNQLADVLTPWLQLPIEHYLVRVQGDDPLGTLQLVRAIVASEAAARDELSAHALTKS